MTDREGFKSTGESDESEETAVPSTSSDDPLGGSDAGVDARADADTDDGTSADAADSDTSLNAATGMSTTDPATEGVARGAASSETVSAPSPATGRLPWLYARDSITDGRDRTVQLHLQSDTEGRQRDVQQELDAKLSDRVRKADLREAALLVGLAHVDELADVLRQWGYDAGD